MTRLLCVALFLVIVSCGPLVKTTSVYTTNAESGYFTTCRGWWWSSWHYDMHSCFREALRRCKGGYRLVGFDRSLPGEWPEVGNSNHSQGFYESGMYYSCE